MEPLVRMDFSRTPSVRPAVESFPVRVVHIAHLEQDRSCLTNEREDITVDRQPHSTDVLGGSIALLEDGDLSVTELQLDRAMRYVGLVPVVGLSFGLDAPSPQK